MMGKCQVCKDKVEQWFGSFEGTDVSKEMFWYEWSRGSECNQTVHSRKKKRRELVMVAKARTTEDLKRKLELEL